MTDHRSYKVRRASQVIVVAATSVLILTSCQNTNDTLTTGAGDDQQQAAPSTAAASDPRFPDWYHPEVVERIDNLSTGETASFAETMKIFEPRDNGPISVAEARERSALNADNPKEVDLERDVDVVATSWEEGAKLVDMQPDSEPRLGRSSEVMVVTVRAPITNTDGPADSKLQTYDSYVVLYETKSAWGFTICMGCTGKGDDGRSTTTQPRDE